MATRRVVRVVARGLTTSFRYPHFVQQAQPTFVTPPPATIYGHLASALGEFPDPQEVAFAYRFEHGGRFTDFEHTYIVGGGVNMNPFERQLLAFPRLTLYLDAPDLDRWVRAFRSPRYAVCLGRSQDLMTYESVEIVELEQPEKMVFAQTLVSLPFAGRLGGTVSVLMPRYITPDRQATWQQYGVVRRPAVWPPDPRDPEEDDEDDDAPPTLQFVDDRFDLWADPAAPPIGRHLRGYEFHRFVPVAAPVA